MLAKIKNQKFYYWLCLSIQKNFPLDNNLLANMVFSDPAKSNHDKTEAALKAICEKMPDFTEDETDQVVSQLRCLQLNKSDFKGTDYEKCLKLVQDGSLLFNDLRIDEVWSPIIKNKRYQVNLL